jgi:hypothetical protein
MVVVNKSNSNMIELIERERANNKRTSWNLADKDIVEKKQYLMSNCGTHLEMIEIKDMGYDVSIVQAFVIFPLVCSTFIAFMNNKNGLHSLKLSLSSSIAGATFGILSSILL